MSKFGWQSHIPFYWLPDEIRRRGRRAAVVVFAVVMAVLVVRAVARLWVGHQLSGEVARLEKIYGSLDPATGSPRWRSGPGSPGLRAALPTRDNRAVVVRAAASLLVIDNEEWQRVARTWLSGTGTTASVADVRRIVDDNRLAVQVAEHARTRSSSDWEIDYAYDNNIPPLLDIRRLGAVLRLECRVDLDAERGGEQASEAALTGLAVTASLRDEPVIILQLIRIAVANDQFACVRDLLERGQPSPAALARLALALAENRAPDAIRLAAIADLKRTHRLLSEAAETNGPWPAGGWRSWGAGSARWLGVPVIQYAHLRYLRGATAEIASASGAPDAGISPDAAASPKPSGRRDVGRLLERASGLTFNHDGWSRAANAGREYSAVLAAAELSVALRRFRLERGVYPLSLAELVPGQLTEVPQDPFTNAPPQYSRDRSGVTLRVRGGSVTTSATPLLVWTNPQ